jgi:hypothetical protein
MALTPQLYYADLVAARAASPFPFAGFSFDQLAWAIANAMVSWGPTVTLMGVATGTAGVGALNTPLTKLFLAPNPPLVIAGLSSAGMVGPLATALGTVVGQAIPKTISSWGNYAGGVAGVGTGADVSKVVGASAAGLTSILLPLLQAFLGPGPAATMMARGLGTGIANLVLTATGTGSVVGSASIVPAAGSSTSVMV